MKGEGEEAKGESYKSVTVKSPVPNHKNLPAHQSDKKGWNRCILDNDSKNNVKPRSNTGTGQRASYTNIHKKGIDKLNKN